MIKKEFAKLYAQKEDIYNVEAERRINLMLDLMSEVLKKNEILIFRGFGSFQVKKSKKKMGVNPKTGETIEIMPKKVIKFKASKSLF